MTRRSNVPSANWPNNTIPIKTPVTKGQNRNLKRSTKPIPCSPMRTSAASMIALARNGNNTPVPVAGPRISTGAVAALVVVPVGALAALVVARGPCRPKSLNSSLATPAFLASSNHSLAAMPVVVAAWAVHGATAPVVLAAALTHMALHRLANKKCQSR